MIEIKPLEKKDIKFLYDLMNNKQIRKYFANPKQFSYEEHLKFVSKFNGDIYIIYKNITPIGSVRVRLTDMEVTIALLSEYQGKGYGTIALRKCVDYYSVELKAEINMENVSSIKMFEKCGFRLAHGVWKK